MGLAQREPIPGAQPDLFVGEPASSAYTPKPEHVLNRLVEMLAEMRAAKAWPWDEAQLDLYRNYVWPHLLKHLPEADAVRWAGDLAAEADRLDAA